MNFELLLQLSSEQVNQDILFDGMHWILDHAETISDCNIERVQALDGSRISRAIKGRSPRSTGRFGRAVRRLFLGACRPHQVSGVGIDNRRRQARICPRGI
ncbi:MAG: hypothetical protein AAGD25_34955 [Cyanobacteria bacterium P01_F01_bin.150]